MFCLQVEDCNEPFIDSIREYDDGKDLSRYDFKQDEFASPTDDLNKRKLAYRHRAVAERYEKVTGAFSFVYLLLGCYMTTQVGSFFSLLLLQ